MKRDIQEAQITRRGFLVRAAAVTLALGSVRGWAQTTATKTARWNAAMELAVSVELNQPAGGRFFQRPYVAVWIEDANGNAVRTLGLWVAAGGRGARYIPELRRWFRDERDREARDGGDLVATVSSPTRVPGKYTLVWDGKNDKKAAVNEGDYYLCVEAAREHGTYQLIREKLTVGDKAFTRSLDGNVEIKGVTVEYRARK